MGNVLAIVGPTGTGKTALAVALAMRLGGEIVNADSRQIYRGMDIGTAKPSAAERAQVPHHLLDLVDPDASYSLAQYLQDARAVIERLHAAGKTAWLVGGTGQYVWGLLEGWRPPAVAPDPALRARLEARAAADRGKALYAELKVRDPEAAMWIDPRNVRRVIRALEVIEATGRPFSAQRRRTPLPWQTYILGLNLDRATLYRRLDARIEQMVAAGWIAEVERLLSLGYTSDLPAFGSLGYRAIAAYLEGRMTLAEALTRAKLDTHRYVRQQLTWFRANDPRIHWLDATVLPVEPALRLAVDFLGTPG